jgi:hypothetical protein
MPLITLPAHFDGEKICLDEPFTLSSNTKLMIVVLSDLKDAMKASGLRLGELPEIFSTLPHLSKTETEDFEKDLQAIRTQFNGEELKNPWESC